MDTIQKRFEEELDNYLMSVEKMGARSVELQADWLYARVEGHDYDSHKMSLCYVAMIKEMQTEDKIIGKRSGENEGAPLLIKYQMPRRPKKSTHEEMEEGQKMYKTSLHTLARKSKKITGYCWALLWWGTLLRVRMLPCNKRCLWPT